MGRGERLLRVRRLLAERGLDALLVTDRRNIRWLTGFSGSSGLALVSAEGAYLVTDFRYRLQARAELDGFEYVEQEGGGDRFLASFLGGFRFRRAGFESTASYACIRRLRRCSRPARLTPVDDLLEGLRMVKDDGEVAAIERSAAAAAGGWLDFAASLRPGVTEREAALDLEWALRRAGSDLPPFPLIVAAGEGAARPHYRPGDRVIREGEAVLFDFGASVDGYASDVTRTVCLGEPPPEVASAYRLVYDAQRAGLEAVRPGARCADVDAAARAVIAAAGKGDLFGHSLGHGVGLDVHEAPGLSPDSREVLRPGMVVTVEPGVYLEGVGGVRIEDLVLVTGGGHRVLTSAVPRPESLGRP